MPRPKAPKATTPDAGKNTAPAKGPNYGELIYGDTGVDANTKAQILALADKANKSKSNEDVKAFHESLFNEGGIGTGLNEQTRRQLSEMITYGPQGRQPRGKSRQRPHMPEGNVPGGGGGTPGGGGGGYNRQPLSEEAKGWAGDVLSGDLERINERNPYLENLMDPDKQDPTKNPYIQAMIEGLQRETKEDFTGNLAALNEQAEGAGRYGSGFYGAMRTRASEEASEAVADATSKLYAGAYENERNRQAGLTSEFMQQQTSAARIPIEFGQLDVARGQLGVARGQLGLARSEFAFNKKMATLAAQQDAVNSYLNILAGIGSMGGSQWGTNAGEFIPSQNPVGAAAMGGMGGYLAMRNAGRQA